MPEYKIVAEIYLDADNAVQARYDFEAGLAEHWGAIIESIEPSNRDAPAPASASEC